MLIEAYWRSTQIGDDSDYKSTKMLFQIPYPSCQTIPLSKLKATSSPQTPQTTKLPSPAGHPTIVAFVKDADDVASTLAFVRSTSPRLPLAIRGGGHSSSGASSVENGLFIDLSRYCNSVRVDPENKLAYVGGGALWADVDREASMGSPVLPVPSVIGLTLGGGFGWLAAEHGLVVDNLVQVTLITADSQILTVNANSYPDLWWGIRGGGCNFGVVTEFVYRIHPQRKTVYGGVLIFTPDALDKLVPATAAWWERGPHEKEGMMQLMTVGPDRRVCKFDLISCIYSQSMYSHA